MNATPTNEFYLGLSAAGFHRLHYMTWGQPTEKEPVICVHGLTRNSHDFDFLAQDLAKDRWVACLDVAGRGQSDWLANSNLYGYPQYMADATALIARLNQPRFDWVGTSMGGLIGMFLAGQPQTPLRRLVMNDIGAVIPANALTRIRNYVSLHPRFTSLEQANKYIRQILAPFGNLADEQWNHLTHNSIRQDDTGSYVLNYDPDIIKSISQEPEDHDIELWPLWEKVTCPVLLVHGQNSDLLTPNIIAQMKERKKDLEVITFPDTGHAPSLMNTEQTQYIRSFFDSPK
jgi:pimeloyl-ACP methyl ester carboxylesterase